MNGTGHPIRVPVIDLAEVSAGGGPHNAGRGTFAEVDGNLQPPPAPRFSRSRALALGPSAPVEDARDILKEWGIKS